MPLKKIAEIPGFELVYDEPFFHEFVVRCPIPVEDVNNLLIDHGILGGLDLGVVSPDLENHMLVAVTEMNSREEINYLCDVLREVSNA